MVAESKRGLADPSELLPVVEAAWGDTQVRKAIPESALRELLAIAWYGTLAKEEGRPSRFLLGVTTQDHISKFCGFPNVNIVPRMWTKPVALTVDSLRKLTPAFPPERLAILVGWNASQKQWQMWSDATIDTLTTFRSGPGYASEHAPLLLTGSGPGRLTLSRAATPFAQLDRGTLRFPTATAFRNSFVQDFFKSFIDATVTALRETNPSAKDREEFFVRSDCTEHLVRVLRHLVKRAVEIGHGGTFVILDRWERLKDYPFLRQTFTFASPQSSGLFMFYGWMQTMRELSLKPPAEFGETVPAQWRQLTDTMQELADGAIDDAAQLSAIDGAVVLDSTLGVWGFGNHIVNVPQELSEIDVIGWAEEGDWRVLATEQLEGIGTRHSSVYRLCHADPQVLAIVISQDGQVRIVRNMRGRVCVWPQDQDWEIDSGGYGFFAPRLAPWLSKKP